LSPGRRGLFVTVHALEGWQTCDVRPIDKGHQIQSSRAQKERRGATRLVERRQIMDLVGLLISVISGAVGGNIAGAAMQDKSLGTLGNSIAGVLGGGLGSVLLRAVGILAQSGGGSLDLGSIVGNVASGGIGGAILLVVIALIRGTMAKA
jgi:uncharacterized membrane protein YeaQ/YmgE (transglycosylase-associated protein family)